MPPSFSSDCSQPCLPVYLCGVLQGRTCGTQLKRNVNNPIIRTHSSFTLAWFWIWWGPWLMTGPLSLTPLTVWPLAGLQQPHRREREYGPSRWNYMAQPWVSGLKTGIWPFPCGWHHHPAAWFWPPWRLIYAQSLEQHRAELFQFDN